MVFDGVQNYAQLLSRPSRLLKSVIYTELPRVNTWLQKRSWAWKKNARFEVYLFIYL